MVTFSRANAWVAFLVEIDSTPRCPPLFAKISSTQGNECRHDLASITTCRNTGPIYIVVPDQHPN